MVKDRIFHSRTREDLPLGKKMSFPIPSQPPGASDQTPSTSHKSEDSFAVPQSGVDRDALRKRKASKSRPNDLRRSASTPHLGKVGQPDIGVLSPTNDKKRNKLGYHRSSIACSESQPSTNLRRGIAALTLNQAIAEDGRFAARCHYQRTRKGDVPTVFA